MNNEQPRKSLGEVLKINRHRLELTLRQVTEVTGVSNPYLSQLENGKIKHPSANILYRLAGLYGITIDELLYASGKVESINLLPKEMLTEDEEAQLIKYLQFLRSQKSKPPPHNI